MAVGHYPFLLEGKGEQRAPVPLTEGWDRTFQGMALAPTQTRLPGAVQAGAALDSPRACLTLMGCVASELSPTPASLTDLMQKSYSFPVLSPGTVNLGEKKGQPSGHPNSWHYLDHLVG